MPLVSRVILYDDKCFWSLTKKFLFESAFIFICSLVYTLLGQFESNEKHHSVKFIRNNSFLYCGCRWKWNVIIAVNWKIYCDDHISLSSLRKLCMRTYSVSSERHPISCMDIYRNISLSMICIFFSHLLKSLSKRSAYATLKRSSVSMKRSTQLLVSKTGSKQHYSPESYRSILWLWLPWKTNPTEFSPHRHATR